MVKSKIVKSAVVFLFFAITGIMTSRLWPGPAFSNAGGLVQYKVVSSGSANTVYEYEKLLNDMAFQGWQFDHRVVEKEWAVFRK